ncbi:MAG TPA: ketosteroid isomerase family protein [Allocoleopsis sp.]
MQPAPQIDHPSPRFNIPSSSTGSKIEQVISCYFQTLNAEDFQATSSLFAIDGKLYPPMETAITGREAIESYLNAEAKGMKLVPSKYSVVQSPHQTECQVAGKVNTPFFGVNVAWKFILNSEAEIVSVQVKLLAALEELMNLKF